MEHRSARYLSIMAAGLSLLLVAACGPGGQTSPKPASEAKGKAQQVSVQMSEFKFEPATVTASPNQLVVLTLRNGGSVVHDWSAQGLSGATSSKVQPGQTATLQFTPNLPGTFEVVCTEPGHREGGMTGELIVQ